MDRDDHFLLPSTGKSKNFNLHRLRFNKQTTLDFVSDVGLVLHAVFIVIRISVTFFSSEAKDTCNFFLCFCQYRQNELMTLRNLVNRHEENHVLMRQTLSCFVIIHQGRQTKINIVCSIDIVKRYQCQTYCCTCSLFSLHIYIYINGQFRMDVVSDRFLMDLKTDK